MQYDVILDEWSFLLINLTEWLIAAELERDIQSQRSSRKESILHFQ